MRRLVLSLLVPALLASPLPADTPGTTAITNPILFVTQVPTPADFTAVASVFGNHLSDMEAAPRGGDLYIRYPNGTLKNLTQAAGYGQSGQQGANAIAVREPSVHWSGTKAVFSMVVGAPTAQYQVATFYWQLYEITGLGQADTPVITKVPNQPPDYNNVSPIYGTDERIIFTSDRPRNGQRHLWPQRDEYEEAPTVTGLWSLNPATGDLKLINHSPSGVFSPTIDSYGRVIFTRWDHLQRDQQADADATGGDTYGTFNYADETAGAAKLNDRTEVFPEPRASRTDLLAGTNLEGHSINQFFPWQINEDGTEEETINHVGRHEMQSYFNRAFNDDPNLVEFISAVTGRVNTNSTVNILQMKEDPSLPGRDYAIDAPEFSTHAAGQIISFSAPPNLAPDQITVTYRTHRDTASFVDEGGTPGPENSGHYRNPLPLADGTVIAAHTSETRADQNGGNRANPVSRYAFRLKTLKLQGGYWVPDTNLTSGITKAVTFWDPDVLVTYNTTMWELDPVEVKVRTKPTRPAPALEAPEQQIFTEEGVDPSAFKTYLAANNLSVIVSRNVTTRDKLDRQQPFNLKITGTTTQTVGTGGKVYDVAYMQLFQADQLRGIGGTANPRPGRRVIAQLMHEPGVVNPPTPGGPASSVKLGTDGSMAAFVPSHRALTWHLTTGAGASVVKERYWLTFQPGEIRVCASCHGLSSKDQANQTVPTNKPEALRTLLQQWKSTQAPSIAAGAAVSRARGASASATIATVSDPQTAAGSLTVTVQSTPAGVTITGLVNTNGTVTATVAASCVAALGTANAVLQVSDGALTTTANLPVTVTADTVAPVVTPPAGVTVEQSTCTGGPGVTLQTLQTKNPAGFTLVSSFLAAGSAVDSCTASPTRLSNQLLGLDIVSTTLFPVGTSNVAFRFRDADNNVGTATGPLTVRKQGDPDLDGDVDIFDNLILQNFVVGNVTPGVAPFLGTAKGADANGDGVVDLFDILLHAGYIVGNVTCLTP